MPIEDTPRRKPSGFLTFVWALFFFFIFSLLVVIWVRGSGAKATLPDQRAAARQTRLQELNKADDEKLQGTGWVDEGKQIARIPIADAKRVLVAELKSKKVAPSQVAVEAPLPMPPPPDPNAAEPPPPPLPSAPQGADTIRFHLPAAAPAAPPPASPAAPTAPAPVPAPAPAAASTGAPTAAEAIAAPRQPLIRATENSPSLQ